MTTYENWYRKILTARLDALRAQVQCLERQLRQWQASCDELRKERDELASLLREVKPNISVLRSTWARNWCLRAEQAISGKAVGDE